jgi:hypothetical protein
VQVLNWNIAGAKYLELPEGRREEFRRRLNATLMSVVETDKPTVVIQEVVRYNEDDNEVEATHVIDVPEGYAYLGCTSEPEPGAAMIAPLVPGVVASSFNRSNSLRQKLAEKLRITARAILLRGKFVKPGSAIRCLVLARLCSKANRRIALIDSSRLVAAAYVAHLLLIVRTINDSVSFALFCRGKGSQACSTLEKLLLSGSARNLSSWLQREILRVPLPDLFPDSRPECKYLFHGAVVQKSLGLCRATRIRAAVV